MVRESGTLLAVARSGTVSAPDTAAASAHRERHPDPSPIGGEGTSGRPSDTDETRRYDRG